MALRVPLPERLNQWRDQGTHPGLLLDKFVQSWNSDRRALKWQEEIQRPTCDDVARRSQQCPAGFDVARLLERRQRMLGGLPGIRVLSCKTTGPLTLHLARASALENAGICLHPIYGFVYLPGSGLKGMARAYAETVWLKGQADGRSAWRQIEDVFGWAPNPDRRRVLNDLEHPARPRHRADADGKSPELTACVGGVVFHDAWPVGWPKLQLDIVNNHHSEYYAGKDDPGDWENPSMVSFLCIGAGETFSFALSKRRADVADDLVGLAQRWLMGALVHEGAGAKTAAGYGCFELVDAPETSTTKEEVKADWHSAQTKQARLEFDCVLELVTPAFLAGARQQAEDCDLRPATLRGLLRWWWRTMHAGFVDTDTLRRMEAAVWGDTKQGGAVRVVLKSDAGNRHRPYERSKIIRGARLESPPSTPRTSQGLTYHSFGMDERGRRRFYVEPGAKWTLWLTARASSYQHSTGKRALDPAMLLEQAKAALWLLCYFGGVGSKCRKGFGSLEVPARLPGFSPELCQSLGEQFRRACGEEAMHFREDKARSPSLQLRLLFKDIETAWEKNVWHALDQIGMAAQRFAQRYKHNSQKKALGLPRNIRPAGSFRAGKHVQATDRHASPVLYHLARSATGKLVIRVTVFPSAELPTLRESARFLQQELLPALNETFLGSSGITRKPEPQAQSSDEGGDGAATPAAQPANPALPQTNERVQAELLEQKTKGGGWRARHLETGLEGPIQNSGDVPADMKPGEKVTLIVRYAKANEIALRWPTAADDAKPPRSNRGPGPRGPGKPPPRRR